MARHELRGGAAALTLNANITSMSTTCQANGSTAGFPTGAVNPFVVTIGSERILCSALAGSSPATITFAQRGYDGTTAASHTAGDEIVHGLAAAEIDDLMGHVYDESRDDHGQYLTEGRHEDVPHTPSMFANGAVENAALADDAVDARVLADDAVGPAALADDAVGPAAIADDAILTAAIGDNQITAPLMADDAVNGDTIADGGITDPAKFGDESVPFTAQQNEAPRGYIGRGARTSMLTSLNNVGGHAITGCSVTFTAVANRRYKATASLRTDVGSGISNVIVEILEGLTVLCRIGDHLAAAAGQVFRDCGDIDWVPGAGSKTITLAVTFSANSDNEAGGSSATDPAFLRIEDIGGT